MPSHLLREFLEMDGSGNTGFQTDFPIKPLGAEWYFQTYFDPKLGSLFGCLGPLQKQNAKIVFT